MKGIIDQVYAKKRESLWQDEECVRWQRVRVKTQDCTSHCRCQRCLGRIYPSNLYQVCLEHNEGLKLCLLWLTGFWRWHVSFIVIRQWCDLMSGDILQVSKSIMPDHAMRFLSHFKELTLTKGQNCILVDHMTHKKMAQPKL